MPVKAVSLDLDHAAPRPQHPAVCQVGAVHAHHHVCQLRRRHAACQVGDFGLWQRKASEACFNGSIPTYPEGDPVNASLLPARPWPLKRSHILATPVRARSPPST